MNNNIETDRIAYTVPEAAKAIGIGRTKMYQIINDGRIIARKIDNMTVVLRSDLISFAENLDNYGRS